MSEKVATLDPHLDDLSIEELDMLIQKAREKRKAKNPDSTHINARIDSVKIHIDATLVAVAKLLDLAYVPESKWEEVRAQLDRLSSDRYKDEAKKVEIPEWKPRQRKKTGRKAA